MHPDYMLWYTYNKILSKLCEKLPNDHIYYESELYMYMYELVCCVWYSKYMILHTVPNLSVVQQISQSDVYTKLKSLHCLTIWWGPSNCKTTCTIRTPFYIPVQSKNIKGFQFGWLLFETKFWSLGMKRYTTTYIYPQPKKLA